MLSSRIFVVDKLQKLDRDILRGKSEGSVYKNLYLLLPSFIPRF